jgi:hypothetical protein
MKMKLLNIKYTLEDYLHISATNDTIENTNKVFTCITTNKCLVMKSRYIAKDQLDIIVFHKRTTYVLIHRYQ